MYLFVGSYTQKAGPFSVARLEMDLPFRDRLAYKRVHMRSASPFTAVRFLGPGDAGGFAFCPARCEHSTGSTVPPSRLLLYHAFLVVVGFPANNRPPETTLHFTATGFPRAFRCRRMLTPPRAFVQARSGGLGWTWRIFLTSSGADGDQLLAAAAVAVEEEVTATAAALLLLVAGHEVAAGCNCLRPRHRRRRPHRCRRPRPQTSAAAAAVSTPRPAQPMLTALQNGGPNRL